MRKSKEDGIVYILIVVSKTGGFLSNHFFVDRESRDRMAKSMTEEGSDVMVGSMMGERLLCLDKWDENDCN